MAMTVQSTEVRLGDGKPKLAGTWDYYGDLDPIHTSNAVYRWNATFSIGVFQWEGKGTQKGTKKGKVLKRFTGSVDEPHLVYEKAISFIQQQKTAQ